MMDIYNKTNVDVRVESPKVGTAESVRLLREMEKSALENVLNTVTLSNNVFEAKFVYYQPAGIEDLIYVRTIFLLNGTKYMIEDKISRFEWEEKVKEMPYSDIKSKRIMALYETLSKVIAKELIEKDGDLKKQLL